MVAGILTIIFLAVRSRNLPEPVPQNDNQEDRSDSARVEARLILDEPSVSPVFSFGGERVWFVASDGKMYSFPVSGGGTREQYALPAVLQNVARIIWQKNGSNFIAEQNQEGHIRYQYFDAEKKTFSTYPFQVREPRFLYDDSRIVYDWVNAEGGHNLTVAKADSTNYHEVMDLPRAYYHFAFSGVANEVAIFADNTIDPAALLLTDLGTGMSREIAKKAAYEGVKFSPDGKKLLVSRRAAGPRALPEFMLLDMEQKTETSLNLSSEISAAEWLPDGSGILVAVPGSLKQYSVSDAKIETVYAKEGFTATNLLVHPTQPAVLYTDPATGKLYFLRYK